MNNVSKLLTLCLTLPAISLSAAFVCVDDFEGGGVLGNSVSESGWFGDNKALTYTTLSQAPDNADNQVLKTTCSTASTAIYLNLGAGGTIAAGSTGTVFFRVYYSSSVNYAMAYGAGYSGDMDRVLQAQITTSSIVASKWQAASSGTALLNMTTPGSLLTGAWYNIWIVMNPNGVANTWQAYYTVNGGAQTMFASSSASTFSFKKGALYDCPTDRFEIIFTGVSSVVPGDAAAVYFDDIYVDNTGRNLSVPIPEAGACVWGGGVAIILGGALLRRRRGQGKIV